MEPKNNNQESKQDYNKEGKYRDEIFQLLEGVINCKNDAEHEFFRQLFKGDSMDNQELIELIKKL